MPSAEHIADTVNRYISLVAKGSADDLVELYADDATVEDPVGGGEVHIGRQAIHSFAGCQDLEHFSLRYRVLGAPGPSHLGTWERGIEETNSTVIGEIL